MAWRVRFLVLAAASGLWFLVVGPLTVRIASQWSSSGQLRSAAPLTAGILLGVGAYLQLPGMAGRSTRGVVLAAAGLVFLVAAWLTIGYSTAGAYGGSGTLLFLMVGLALLAVGVALLPRGGRRSAILFAAALEAVVLGPGLVGPLVDGGPMREANYLPVLLTYALGFILVAWAAADAPGSRASWRGGEVVLGGLLLVGVGYVLHPVGFGDSFWRSLAMPPDIVGLGAVVGGVIAMLRSSAAEPRRAAG